MREDFLASERAMGRVPLAENGFYMARRLASCCAHQCRTFSSIVWDHVPMSDQVVGCVRACVSAHGCGFG